MVQLTMLVSPLSIALNLVVSPAAYGWIAGCLSSFGANLAVALLPLVRGYAFVSQWDDVNHHSFALDILKYGLPGSSNFYPISHILAAAFSAVSGLDLHKALLLFPLLFYLTYLSAVACFAWTLGLSPAVKGLVMAFSLPFVFNFYSAIFRPNQFFAYLFPLLLVFVYRTRLRSFGFKDSIPFVLTLLFLPFFHPWAVIASAIYLIAIAIPLKIERRKGLLSRYRSNLTPLLILLVTWFVWFSTFKVFGVTLDRLVRSFVAESTGEELLSRYLLSARRAGLPLSRLLSLTFYTYGPLLFFLLPVGIVLLGLLYRRLRQAGPPHTHVSPLSASLLCFSLVFLGLALASLVKDLVTQSPYRLANFAVVAVPLFVPPLAHELFVYLKAQARSRLALFYLVSLFALLALSAALGIFNMSLSPRTGSPNQAFTYSQQAGLRFLLDRRLLAAAGRVYSPSGNPSVLSSVISTAEYRLLRRRLPGWRLAAAPAHFGYPPAGLDPDFQDPAYLWVSAPERAYYTQVWPQGGRFTPADFARLEDDPRWHRVYTTADITIWGWVDSN